MKSFQSFFAIGVSVIAIAALGCGKSDDAGKRATGTGGMPGAVGTGGIAPVGSGGATGGVAGMGAGQPGTATFAMVYSTVIVGSGCLAGIACHSQPAGSLRMVDQASAYTSLVGVMAMGTNTMGGTTNCAGSGLMRVKAGDPDGSLLVQKVSGTPPCGIAMPPGGMIKPENLTLLRTWIQNGANND